MEVQAEYPLNWTIAKEKRTGKKTSARYVHPGQMNEDQVERTLQRTRGEDSGAKCTNSNCCGEFLLVGENNGAELVLAREY